MAVMKHGASGACLSAGDFCCLLATSSSSVPDVNSLYIGTAVPMFWIYCADQAKCYVCSTQNSTTQGSVNAGLYYCREVFSL